MRELQNIPNRMFQETCTSGTEKHGLERMAETGRQLD